MAGLFEIPIDYPKALALLVGLILCLIAVGLRSPAIASDIFRGLAASPALQFVAGLVLFVLGAIPLGIGLLGLRWYPSEMGVHPSLIALVVVGLGWTAAGALLTAAPRFCAKTLVAAAGPLRVISIGWALPGVYLIAVGTLGWSMF